MKNYFLLKNGQQVGPFSIDDLKAKNIKKTYLVWAEGMADWQKASEITELSSLFTVSPPPPSPPSPPPLQPQAPQHQATQPPPQPQVHQYQAAPPPQPQIQQNQVAPVQQNYATTAQAQSNGYVPLPGSGWIIAGYIFSIMGGLVGIAIGGYLKGSKQKLPDGTKVKKFNAKAQKNGLIIIIVSAISWAFWMQMNK